MTELVRHLLDDLPLDWAALVFVGQNVAVFAAALVVGRWLARIPGPRVTPLAPPIERREWLLACTTVVLNSGITWLGLVLYRRGLIVLSHDVGLRALADVVILLLIMDFAMYWLHRMAHIPFLFWLHAQHHRYAHPRPLTLFVLHPLETLSFGALWLAVLAAFSTWGDGVSWLGIAAYLTLNVAFGLVGHLGVEPFGRHALGALSLLGTSGFHGTHHIRESSNFGFYTSVWDRLFGTWERPKLTR